MNAEQRQLDALDVSLVEELVCAQAAEVLGHPVSASDNFFSLGGDSVRAGRLVMRLTKALHGRGINDMQDVFEAVDFADLSARIYGRLADATSAPAPEPSLPREQAKPLQPQVDDKGRRQIPLTYSQHRRLQRDADSVGQRIAHHVSRSFHVVGPLDLASLEAACHKLVERHEALRSVFDVDLRNGEHRGYRLSAGDIDCDRLFRVRQVPVGACVEEQVQAEQGVLFDLPTEVKLRVLVLCTGENTATVVVTAEHLVCDGDSFTNLVRDLSALYNSRVGASGDAVALPDIEPRCWAEEESRWHQAMLEDRLTHWRSRLDPLEALPEVRLSGMRDPEVRPTSAAQCHGHLTAGTLDRLRKTCAAESTTLFCGFVAALGLAVLADAGHSVAGMVSPTSGRPEGWQHDVDWFATSVINRFRINTELPVRDVLRSAKQSMAAGLTHSVPLPLLLQHLQLNRDLVQKWRPWLYLALDTSDSSPMRLHGAHVEPVAADVQLALRAGLTIRVEMHPDSGATVLFQYEQEVWPAARAKEFMGTFTRMVSLVSENPADTDVATLLRTYQSASHP
ncbi:hypothetical protein K2224_37765 (plasmid) [Streptomyces sp. BHT-5-2]|uniref:condensation domain-containing protein n=1 Tax=unclassified Streptomyces TaxID=2593676 RepID=UPI001C8E0A9F|nr:condensation domain-containing protein [Streptomyces sp. BHT-5-2]QZL08780.1 hypothetical protein K2224_37765 [Streptomyces sp. BHT-5-2]